MGEEGGGEGFEITVDTMTQKSTKVFDAPDRLEPTWRPHQKLCIFSLKLVAKSTLTFALIKFMGY